MTAGSLTLNWLGASGLLDATTIGSVTTSHGYNAFGEPEAMSAAYTDTATSTTTALYDVSYTRDALGRIDTKTETIGGATSVWGYDYDARGRLSDVTKDGGVWRHYGYDANGNRTSASEGGGAAVTGAYDAQDRLTSYGNTTYTYNAMGQLASKTTGSDTTTYTYDELGSLTKVELPTKTIDYVVDGLGRRVAKKVDGTVTDRFVYGQGIQPIAELNASGGTKSQFVYASKGHVPDLMIRDGVTYRYVTDQVGSVRMVVNSATGEVVQRIDYDPFGKVTSDTNPGFQPFGFAGGLYDPDTGQVRFWLRDYDPQIGRWTAKDPIGFVGGDTNLYAYVGSDPVNVIDPVGLSGWNPFGWPGDAIDPVGDFVSAAGDFAMTEVCKIGAAFHDVGVGIWHLAQSITPECALQTFAVFTDLTGTIAFGALAVVQPETALIAGPAAAFNYWLFQEDRKRMMEECVGRPA